MSFFSIFLCWLPMTVLAILNGTVRQFFLLPKVGDLLAHQISSITLILLIAGYTALLVRFWRKFPFKHEWVMGAVWVMLTLIFEFGLGRATGHTWSDLLKDYNIAAGRWWVLVVIWTGLAPKSMSKLIKS